MFTTLFFFVYMNMQKPQPPANPNNADQAAAAKIDENPLFREPAKADTQADPASPQPESAVAPLPESAVTLGSMDPAKKYNLLVTLSTRGASVERVELVGQHSPGKFKFLALEHLGGDLGYLGLVQVDNGMRVRVIPDGSAAASATGSDGSKLKPGDVITKIAGEQIRDHLDVENALSKTKPGQQIEISVERDQQPLQFQVELQHAPLDLLRSQPHSTELIEGNDEINGLRTTLASINSVKIPIGKTSLPALAPTLEQNWQMQPLQVEGGEGVEFRLPLEQLLKETDSPKLELVKRFRLLPSTNGDDGYLLDMETEIINHNEQSISVGVRQEGPTGLNLEGWWYSVKISQAWFSSAGSRDVAFADGDGRHWLKTTSEIYNHAKTNSVQPHKLLFSQGEPLASRTLKYIGLDSQYFNASLLPHSETPNSLSDLAEGGSRVVGNISKINRHQIQAANVTFWVDSSAKPIDPGQSAVQRYQIFLGPKESSLLSSYGLENTIEYGWFPWVAKPLGWILHFFYAIVRNYGLAIILLTVCVRLALFPLGRRAAITGQRMQELQPEIKKINEKYPDMEKRARAMQELYAKHNFKPLAGCLPMFLQIPIFIGLYRCLSVDVSLRQEPLIPGLQWCSNLAGPDQLYNWSSWMPEYFSGRGTGWLGPYLNILPLITVVLFLVQQYVTMPKATDPQSQMSQTMMKWMTAFMAVFFFKVPAGLCIYFITSSIWSLIERQIVKKTIPPSNALAVTSSNEPTTRPKPADRRSSSSEQVKSSAMERMREMLDKPAVRSGTQRGTKKRKDK
jgi:YidC/Oxa1 family membrane protein insertase